MDGGPYRPQRPVDRRAVNRPAATQRQPDELEIVDDEPKVVHRPTPVHHAPKKENSLKKFIVPISAVVAIIIIAAVGWLIYSKSQNTAVAPQIDSSKYQAVFFTNGQVYFGKLSSVNSEYMSLTDIYYLQTQATDKADAQNPQQTATDQNGVQLIKLGDEIHGPEDKMVISKEQMLFYENLKTDGKVAKSIDQYKSTNK
ncbi:hypothetical protein HY312_00445 [Candidatus Saccharibacteria bacterium]|nr:hypothetical protein [Candidatus Saccharibacteria bacterium]